MEKFIFKYLNKKYIIDTSSVGNYGVYVKNEDVDHFRTPYNGSKLSNELTIVFGITEDIAKKYINTWGIKHNNIFLPISLTFYWKNHCGPWYDNIATVPDNFYFPMATRVAATTIGLDLVAVQPLSEPRVLLNYMDFTYGTSDPALTPRVPVNYELDSNEYIESQQVEHFLERQRKWNSSGLLDGLDNIYR